MRVAFPNAIPPAKQAGRPQAKGKWNENASWHDQLLIIRKKSLAPAQYTRIAVFHQPDQIPHHRKAVVRFSILIH
jgi:hypothetical protein